MLDKRTSIEHKTMSSGPENRNVGQGQRNKQICSAMARKKEKLVLNSEANLDPLGLLQSVKKNWPSEYQSLERITGRTKAGRNRLHPEGKTRHFLHLLYFPPSLTKSSIDRKSVV